jgi:hypothetical protein
MSNNQQSPMSKYLKDISQEFVEFASFRTNDAKGDNKEEYLV